VLEGPGQTIVGIEIKASASVAASDFSGLKALADTAGARFLRGVLFYMGDTLLPFGDKLHAVPVSALWQGASPADPVS